MKPSPFKFVIGSGSWAQEIRYYTEELDPEYWANFRPLGDGEIQEIERDVGRTLPGDFKEFLRSFGCGAFPRRYGGLIYSPEDFANGCHGHLWMILGSSEWASEDEQKRYYVTRGAFNPNPKKYTSDSVIFDGISLLDLLQFGTDGLACYHQVYVGDKSGPVGYCLLTPDRTMVSRAPSFSDGLKLILNRHWNKGEPPEELPPEGSFSFE
jgi:hypothetical protein